jgi:protein phosphatase
MMNDIHFQLTAGTDVGLQRSNNEDNFVVSANLAESEWFIPKDKVSHIMLNEKGCLLVVADGMGGMNAGEVASGIAIDSMQKSFLSDKITDDVLHCAASIRKFMSAAIISADNAIKAHTQENPDTSGMGTTIIMAWILDRKVYISWCGDSRAYSFHPKSGLIRLSKDHSYVQELVDDGSLNEEAAFDHPDSNIITRSLGEPGKIAESDFVEHDLYNGEVILLCTDGLSGMLRDWAIEKIMADTAEDIDVCKSTLIESALREGGHDNVTVALCKIVSGADVADVADDVGKDVAEDASVGRVTNSDITIADEIDKKVMPPPRMKKSLVVKLILIIGILLLCLIALGLYYIFVIDKTT